MNIPLFDLSRLINVHHNSLVDAFEKCINHSKFIMGPEIELFEDAFSKKVNSNYCIGYSSGTDSLLSIFMALDLAPGSEILVPSFTFMSSASSILRAGLKPVFVDLAKDSFHPSYDTIKEAWTEKTRGVLFVHLFGEPEDLSDIKDLCDQKGAVLIEDCAQSFGSTAGRTGLASAYSFFPAKNLGCLGDGGAVTTDCENFAEKIKAIRVHGCHKKYHYKFLGGNFRMDTMQAGFLNIFLKESDAWISSRRDNAKYYANELGDIHGLILPRDCPGHAWNQYSIRVSCRDELKNFLDKNKIGNAIYYPIPLHHSRHIFGSSRQLNETDARCKEVLSIPIYPGLTKEERSVVASKIKEFFK